MLIHALQNRSTVLARWLSLALVVFILYGTTVEAAHRHGRVLPANSTASLLEPEQTSSPVTSKTGCSDCLICQLHQNFATTLVAYRLDVPPTQLKTRFSTAAPPDVHFRLAGPAAGRAPPSIS